MREIAFETKLFPSAPEGDLDLNNGMPGSAAAAWARAVVESAGQPCREPVQEDCGWGFWLHSDCRIWVAVSFCGAPGEQNAAEPAEWVISVAHSKPLFSPSGWFKKDGCGALSDKIFSAIDAAVRANPEFTARD